MVTYEPSDLIPIEEFSFAWRITDPRWSSQPGEVLERIKPLSESKSRSLYDKSPLALPRSSPPDVGGLRITREQSMRESGTPEGDAECARWFRSLPIEPERQVYVCWSNGGGVAAITDWGTFCRIWDDLYYPFDRMCVFDDSPDWVVLFGPEDIARFAEMSSGRAPSRSQVAFHPAATTERKP